MVVSRAGKVEADDAQRFLLEVDEENCIQIAMHADFADDCLCLTRYPCIHVHCGVGYATVTHMAPQPVSILAVASHPVPMDTCTYTISHLPSGSCSPLCRPGILTSKIATRLSCTEQLAILCESWSACMLRGDVP